MVLTKDLFEKMGFDVSKEPYTKEAGDGTIYIYKNKIRDGSGEYDGYAIIKPKSRIIRTLDDFLCED